MVTFGETTHGNPRYCYLELPLQYEIHVSVIAHPRISLANNDFPVIKTGGLLMWNNPVLQVDKPIIHRWVIHDLYRLYFLCGQFLDAQSLDTFFW